MPSTFDPLLRLELQATGENGTSWGTRTNNNLGLIAAAVAGIAVVSVSAGDTTLTTADALADQARCAILLVQGTLTANANIIVPASPKSYIFIRNTTGAFDITVKQSAATGTVLPASGPALVVNTSTTSIDLMAGLLDNYGIRITETV
jgi:hypothetical protein